MNKLTLNLHEAAELLRMHPEEVRARAKAGQLPAAKPGRSWVFITEDLLSYLRGEYHLRWQSTQVPKQPEEVSPWASNVEANIGTVISSRQTEDEYGKLLRLPTNEKRKSCTTG